MTKLLVAIFTVTAISAGGYAMAQPAYDSAEGPPPASYPPCTHPHEDRCVQGRGMDMHHHHHHH